MFNKEVCASTYLQRKLFCRCEKKDILKFIKYWNTEFHWQGKNGKHCFCRKKKKKVFKIRQKRNIKESLSFGPVVPESSVENKHTMINTPGCLNLHKKTKYSSYVYYCLLYVYLSDFPAMYDILRPPAPKLDFCPLPNFCWTNILKFIKHWQNIYCSNTQMFFKK